MFVEIDAGSSVLRVGEPADLKRLDVRVVAGDRAEAMAQLAAAGMGRLDSADHADDADDMWLDVAALREACGPQPADWAAGFVAMIQYAAGKGWASPDCAQVQAHITRAPWIG